MSDDLERKKRRRWTNQQTWSFAVTTAGVVVSIIAVVAQIYLAR